MHFSSCFKLRYLELGEELKIFGKLFVTLRFFLILTYKLFLVLVVQSNSLTIFSARFCVILW